MNVLVPDPRDIRRLILDHTRRTRVTAMSAVNTLFNALANAVPEFATLDFSMLEVRHWQVAPPCRAARRRTLARDHRDRPG